jgi:hypothetical protein
MLGMNKTISPKAFDTGKGKQQVHYATPDFLRRLVASANFMRFSLQKTAHAALSSAAWQEIRVRSGRDDNSFATLTFPIDNLRVVHSILNLPQASQTLGMTKGRVALSLDVVMPTACGVLFIPRAVLRPRSPLLRALPAEPTRSRLQPK